MRSIATELDQALAVLGGQAARALESSIRQQIAQATSEQAEWQRVMALMRKNHPQAAECVGVFADTDFERPQQGPTPAAKTW